MNLENFSSAHVILVIAACASAFAVAYGVTPLTARIAHAVGVIDQPIADTYKTHARATPYLGGVAIFLGSIAGSTLILVALGSEAVQLIRGFPLAIGVALLLGMIGLLDDIRHLPPVVRFGAEMLTGVAAWFNGFQVSITPWTSVNLFLTVLWIVGITNAFNLLDNMDGLTAGVAGIAALAFGAMGVFGGMPALAIAAASLGGASVGFLAHNRHPAKVFMGDAGSLFVGLLLALIGVRLRFDNLPQVTFLIPVIVLGLPIFDTTLVVISRLRHGRRIFEGGRDHVSHRLVRLGLPVPAAVGLLYWAALCLGWLGLVISRANPQVAWMLLGFVLVMGIFFGVLLLRVPAHDEPEAQHSDKRAALREGAPYIDSTETAAHPLTAPDVP